MKTKKQSVVVKANEDLYHAAHAGRLNEVLALLKNPQINPNYSPSGLLNRTPLRQAAFKGEAHVVYALLKHPQIDVNQAKVDDNCTPIYAAAQNDCQQVVEFLLAHPQTDVNIRHVDGYSPLMIAAQQGHLQMVKILLALAPQIDTSIRTIQGSGMWNFQTAAERARSEGHLEIADLIDAFDRNKEVVKAKLRTELRVDERLTAALFVLVVLLTDDYLQIIPNPPPKFMKAVRFFRILERLPMEIQMGICHRAYSLPDRFVLTSVFDQALKLILFDCSL